MPLTIPTGWEFRQRLATVLPEAEDVVLGVGEVGGEPHVADRHPFPHHSTAKTFYCLECLLNVIDLDRDDRRGDGLLACEHAAIDRTRLARSTLRRWGRAHQGVSHARDAVDVPGERVAVEALSPAEVLGWDLEMHHAPAHVRPRFVWPMG